METADVREKVVQIIVEQLGGDEAEIIDTAHLMDDLGADSLDAIELTMALEEEFKLDIPDKMASKLFTVGDIVQYVTRATAA